MVYCIGLTGSIASGKTTAAMYFKSVGIDIISADEIARALVEPHQPALLEIQAHFGSNILTAQGTLNRRKLRQHMVNHPADRAWLEACLHPKIRHEIGKQLLKCQTPYVVIEIPLLTRREDYPELNRVLLIRTTRANQISRLTERDQCTESEALAFLEIQENYRAAHAAIADDVIDNDSTREAFLQQLETFHHLYQNLQKTAPGHSCVGGNPCSS